MELLRRQEAYDSRQIIQRFLETAPQEGEIPDERSITARLCAENLQLFRSSIIALSSKDPASFKASLISLERSYGRMKLWSDGYGIAEGRLDDALEKSRRLRQATSRLLISIGSTLTGRLGPFVGDRGTADSTPSIPGDRITNVAMLLQGFGDEVSDSGFSDDSSTFGDDCIDEIAEDLRTDTTCLVELEPLLQTPPLDLANMEVGHDADVQELAPHRFYCDKVENRFPQAEHQLILRLGRANWERYLRCQRDREYWETVVGNMRLEDSETGTVQGSKFHDSALGSSVHTLSSYAETVMSYGGRDGQSVRVPPLPAEAKSGKPFNCVACGRFLRVKNNSGWKKHLYADLCPWLCVVGNCTAGDKVFESRDDWVSHLALDHAFEPEWSAIQCPLCQSNTGSGRFAVTRHLGGHLEEIALAALPTGLDAEGDSDTEGEEGEAGKNRSQASNGSTSQERSDAGPGSSRGERTPDVSQPGNCATEDPLSAALHMRPDSHSGQHQGNTAAGATEEVRGADEMQDRIDRLERLVNALLEGDGNLDSSDTTALNEASGDPEPVPMQSRIDRLEGLVLQLARGNGKTEPPAKPSPLRETVPPLDLRQYTNVDPPPLTSLDNKIPLTETSECVDGVSVEPNLGEKPGRSPRVAVGVSDLSHFNPINLNPEDFDARPLEDRHGHHQDSTGDLPPPMYQQDEPSNSLPDWADISDLAERRRISNRIAQRNYRKKLKKRLEDLERRASGWYDTSVPSLDGQILEAGSDSGVSSNSTPSGKLSSHKLDEKTSAPTGEDYVPPSQSQPEMSPDAPRKTVLAKIHRWGPPGTAFSRPHRPIMRRGGSSEPILPESPLSSPAQEHISGQDENLRAIRGIPDLP